MTNGLFQHIAVEESISIQSVKIQEHLHVYGFCHSVIRFLVNSCLLLSCHRLIKRGKQDDDLSSESLELLKWY